MKRIALSVLLIILAISAVVFFYIVPRHVARSNNFVFQNARVPVSAGARVLHKKLLVADLHADSLLWDRNLLKRGSWGHVDVPRLIDGNVALLGFSVVTSVPRGLNIHRNSADTDSITALAIAQRWPPATWRSLKARALHQAHRLGKLSARSRGRLTLIKTREDLRNYLARRQSEPNVTAGWLTLEGAQALEGNLANLDTLYAAGYRMIAPSHFTDTALAGAAAGIGKGGLTPLGRAWVKRMEEKRMLIDLAHASAATIDDVLALATRPVVVSHTGVRGSCDNNRNLSDHQLRRIAANGGLIGIGFWQFATCGKDVAGIVKAIRHAVAVIGVAHVALGSDFDGYVATPIDAARLPELTQALLSAGFKHDDIAKIMGGNIIRLLALALP